MTRPRTTAPTQTSTWVYCVVDAPKPPTTDDAPSPPPGAGPLRLVPLAPRRWLACADVPADAYDGPAIERGLQDLEWVGARAMAHEAVVEHLAARATVVPMKLFTLFASDERAVKALAKDAARLDAVVARVEGAAEWGLKVALDRRAAQRRAASTASAGGPAGTAFLLRKKAETDAAKHAAGAARAVAEALHDELAALAVDAHENPTALDAATAAAREPLVLDAAYLVRTRARAKFERAVAAAAARLADEGLRLTLTGPWPPYHFVAA